MEDSFVKEIDFHREKYNNPVSAEKVLKFLDGKVIVWMSFESFQINSEMLYKARCLLQYRENTMEVEGSAPYNHIERALIDGVYEAVSHITKPCSLNFITDRIIFYERRSMKTACDDVLMRKVIQAVKQKECQVTEVLIKDSTSLIRDHINEIIGVREYHKKLSLTQDDADKLQMKLNSHLNVNKPQGCVSKLMKQCNKKKKNKTKQKASEERCLIIQCRVCGKDFSMTPSEQLFYEKKGFMLPQRCKECRKKGIRHSDDYYYDRGLKHNSYQKNLDMYGPRINVNGGLDASPGYRLTENKNGKSTYVRSFAGKTDVLKKRHL